MPSFFVTKSVERRISEKAFLIAMQEVEKKASLEIRLFHYTVGEKLISGEGQKDLLEIASRPNPTKFTIKSELKVLTHYEHDIYCAFREIWAVISRDDGQRFHVIVGSDFADAGRLADGFMESGLIGLVKRFCDVCPASQAFS